MGRLTIDAERTSATATEEEYSRLETGDILYFPANPIELPEEDRAFLLRQKQSTAFHKNISYRPAQDRLQGVDAQDEAARRRAHQVMRAYSRHAIAFTARFLSRYAPDWTLDFASFRPIEESGRKLSQRSRNDLIHVDNFPSRPSHGDRLLRVFTNINPDLPRIWVTSESFEPLARRHAAHVGLPRPQSAAAEVGGRAKRLLAWLGLPVVDRPPYDEFMRRFHHYMKANESFQRDCPKQVWSFPPQSTWIVFTDTASHACLSGQYALEQTFIVRRSRLLCPEKAPIAVLEQLTGFPMAARSA